MALPRGAFLLPLLLLCCLPRGTRSQEDAATAPACYGAGSVATAVVLTFLLTALLLAAGSWWWKRYRAKKVPDHLILETDPEKGKGVYAFDNPGFKDASHLAATKQSLDNEKNDLPKSKWQQWAPLSAFTVKSERRKALDDSAIEGDEIKVISLKSHDFTGLGFNICGNMKEGIFVKDLLQRGPASESGKLCSGDRIHSVTINFEHMVYEDALTILGYASPYEVTVEATSGRPAPNSPDQGGQPSHPMYRSSSWSELYRVGKSSKRQLFGEEEPNSTHSSLQKSRSNMTTLERKESKSPKPKQPRVKKPAAKQFSPEKPDAQPEPEVAQKIENKHQKFGVRVLPLEIQQKSPKILEQNDNNINIEKRQFDNSTAMSIDEVDDPKKPPPVKRREKKQPETFDRGSLNGSGIRRTEEGIPLELPLHMLNAASAALRNRDEDARNKRKGKAPAVPEETRSPDETQYNSDSDAEHDCSSVNTIELNATDITIHQTEEEQLQSRKALSAGDLSNMRHRASPIATLERAQSLDISDAKSDDEALRREPRLSLILDGLSTFERNRLKKSSEWGDLEDAILKSGREEPDEEFDAVINKVNELRRAGRDDEPKNQIWPSFDAKLNGPVIPRPAQPAGGRHAPREETDAEPLPPPPPVRIRTVNNRIDEPFEAARSDVARAIVDTEPERNGPQITDSLEPLDVASKTASQRNSPEEILGSDDRRSVEEDKTASKNPDTVDAVPYTKSLDVTVDGTGFAKSNGSIEFPVTASNNVETVGTTLPYTNGRDETVGSDEFAKSRRSVEYSVADNIKASKQPAAVDVIPRINGLQDKMAESNDCAKTYASLEFSVNGNIPASNEPETVKVVPHRSSREKTAIDDDDFAIAHTSLEFPVVGNITASTDAAAVNLTPYRSSHQEVTTENNEAAKSYTSVEFPTAANLTASTVPKTVNLVPHRIIQEETAMSVNNFDESPTESASNDSRSLGLTPPQEVSSRPDDCAKSSAFLESATAEAKIASAALGDPASREKTTRTKSYASFEIPINEDRTRRRQRAPEDEEPKRAHAKPAEVLSKIPLLNSMVESQMRRVSRVGNITDETKTVVTAARPDLLDLTQNFLYTEQMNSHSYGPHTNVPDDIKVSRHPYRETDAVPDDVKSEESSRHVSNVSVTQTPNGDAALHSLELSVNDGESYAGAGIVTVGVGRGSDRVYMADGPDGKTHRSAASAVTVDVVDSDKQSSLSRAVTVDIMDKPGRGGVPDSPENNGDRSSNRAVTVDVIGRSDRGGVPDSLKSNKHSSLSRAVTVDITDELGHGGMPDSPESSTSTVTVDVNRSDRGGVPDSPKRNKQSNLSRAVTVDIMDKLGQGGMPDSPESNGNRSSDRAVTVDVIGRSDRGGVPDSPKRNKQSSLSRAATVDIMDKLGQGGMPDSPEHRNSTSAVTVDIVDSSDRGDAERSSTPTYITEIRVTPNGGDVGEMELAKIKEIAERQLKKLPEMRFTTASYEPPKPPEKRHSNIEHLRSNFEKPKLTRQESSSSISTKSRIPIATSAKTPPTSPERRDSRNLDGEQDKAILELMSASVGAKYQSPPPRNVTVTSIRSGSKIPSGLPTLGGGRSPPRRGDGGGSESSFKQWVFNPSNVTNVVVTDDKRE